MKCSHCKTSEHVIKHRTTKHSITKLYCKKCELWTKKLDAPKILILDIETSRAKFELYWTGKQYVSYQTLVEEAFVLGWAAKWLFDPDMKSSFVTPREAKRRDERRVVKELYKLMDEADLVIAHNGDKFDIPMLNPRFAKYNLVPNNRYLTIDTCAKAKQIFRLPSYSLRYLLNYFNLSPKGHRVDTDLAEKGDRDALLHDEEYCRQDVWGLEELYLKMRGWMKTHPKMNIYYEMYHPLEKGAKYCPRCLDTIGRLQWKKRYRTPSGTVYQSSNCPHCGAVLRGEKLGKAKLEDLIYDAVKTP